MAFCYCFGEFVSAACYSLLILDSYDFAVAIRKDTAYSGMMLGVFFLGTCVSEVILWLAMRKSWITLQSGKAIFVAASIFLVVGSIMETASSLTLRTVGLTAWLPSFVNCSRFVQGLGLGFLNQVSFALLEKFLPQSERGEWMERSYFAFQIGLGMGPLLSACFDLPATQVTENVLAIGVHSMILSTGLLLGVLLYFPSMHDLHDGSKRDSLKEASSKLNGERDIQRRVRILVGSLFATIGRGLVVSSTEVAIAFLLEENFNWDGRSIGLCAACAFMSSLPLQVLVSSVRSQLTLTNWIRTLSLMASFGCGFLTEHATAVAGGYSLVAGAMLIISTLYLADSMCAGLLVQNLLPKNYFLNAENTSILLYLTMDFVGRFVAVWLARWFMKFGQNAFAFVMQALCYSFLITFEIMIRPNISDFEGLVQPPPVV